MLIQKNIIPPEGLVVHQTTPDSIHFPIPLISFIIINMHSVSTLQITAKITNLDKIREFVEFAAASFHVAENAIFDVALAVYEGASNIIEHGYRGVPGEIEVEITHNGDSLVIRLRDHAPVFDPTKLPAPDLSLPLERRPIGGLGVFLMKESVDQLEHIPLPEGGNELVFIKRGVVKT